MERDDNTFVDPLDGDALVWDITSGNYPATQKWPAELMEQAILLFQPEYGWAYVPGPVESLFILHGPDGDCCMVHTGSETAAPYCTCPTFRQETMCVHFLAMEHELFYQNWIRAEEERLECAEHSRYGTDPDMHYDRAGY